MVSSSAMLSSQRTPLDASLETGVASSPVRSLSSGSGASSGHPVSSEMPHCHQVPSEMASK